MIDMRRPVLSSLRSIVTARALAAVRLAHATPEEFIDRHLRGDWGDSDVDAAADNEIALVEGGRVLSTFLLATGVRIWVLTEAIQANGSRAATTLLLPDEY